MDLPTTKTFKNEPYLDFSEDEAQRELQETVSKVVKEFGKVYPLIINGKRINEGKTIRVINPANLDEELGTAHLAENKHFEDAIAAAEHAFELWQDISYHERAAKLLRAAALARKRKLELSVWVSKENGKSMYEAVAEVAEGIDFMEYYARRMNDVGSTPAPAVFDVPGERNKLTYIPLGVGAVIAPWNFPFAILAGMATAALVTGNTVLLKPASITPIIAHHFYEILEEAGFPPGVANYLPAHGSTLGNKLVAHPKIRFIAFTGSTAVGKEIYALGATLSESQKWFKRTILETGGKNHIIVCNDADLKKAVTGVAKSAFGYSGQKCSACSVAVVESQVYDEFLTRLVVYTKKLTLGEGSDPHNFTGPVSSQDSVNKIMGYIELGKKEGKLILGGKQLESVQNKRGYYIEPTIFADLPDTSRLLREELFGPVLAVRKAKSFDDALCIVNASVYGLTGGVFTTNTKNKEYAAKKFHVGNLYFNKASGGSTGAMVGRQPFGGFNLSGTDNKAGGPHYLYLFMQEKSVADMS